MQKNIGFILSGLAILTAVSFHVAEALSIASLGAWAVIPWCASALLLATGIAQRNLRLGVAAAAAISALANAYLLKLKLFPADGSSLCKINTTWDCGSLNSSEYANIFTGTGMELPITVLGLAFFGSLCVASLMSPNKTPRFYQISAGFGLINVLVSLYLLSALIEEATYCVFCMTIYLGNLIILVAALSGMKTQQQTLFGNLGEAMRSRTLIVTSIGFAAIVLGYIAVKDNFEEEIVVITPETPINQIDIKKIAELYSPITKAPQLDGTEPSLGPANATYTIVEFADYGCPHCAEASKDLKRMLAKRDDVNLLFKVFPLTGACNPALQGKERIGPCVAAAAAECGLQQGAFWEVNGDLFTNQRVLASSQWNIEDLSFIARSHKLDEQAFVSCIKNASTMDGVLEDAAAGASLGLQGTPTFYLKGATGERWIMINQPRVSDLTTIMDAHKKGAILPGTAN